MTPPRIDSQSMYAPLRRVLVKRPVQASWQDKHLERHWQSLGYSECPEANLAARQHDDFLRIVAASCGCELTFAPPNDDAGLDSLYIHDGAVVVNGGAILCNMSKQQRSGEPIALASLFMSLEIPVLGFITNPGRLEAGDVLWLDRRTAAVGVGPRTNLQGVEQLAAILRPLDVQVIPVPLPYSAVHLLGLISLVDHDLAVASQRLPEILRAELRARRVAVIDAPELEESKLACNVLAVSPRQCIMVAGCPVTRVMLEARGATVFVYDGSEISIKGSGGPTCLTRPLLRSIDGNGK